MSTISVVLPIYNEEKNIPILLSILTGVLSSYDFEIIAVNDGSKDATLSALEIEAGKNPRIKIIDFVKNFGQTAAIQAGINSSSGDIVVLIDSDLENDPLDIPRLLQKLEEGHDVVSGWRKNRWAGSFFTRKLPSMLANWLISWISGVKLHDYGCTLKVYRKEVIKGIFLYGQMHRFIPVFASWQGGKVAELPVNYKARIHGKSNYGFDRTIKVVLDLILIKFLDKFMQRPIHFFGSFGLISFLLGFLCGGAALYFKIMGMKDLIQTPLPTLSAMFLTIGVMMILLGLLAEIVMRTYYESQHKDPFIIKNKINF